MSIPALFVPVDVSAGAEEVPDISIIGEEGRELLTVHRDGTVTGSVEDASEAGRLFVEAVRRHAHLLHEPLLPGQR